MPDLTQRYASIEQSKPQIHVAQGIVNSAASKGKDCVTHAGIFHRLCSMTSQQCACKMLLYAKWLPRYAAHIMAHNRMRYCKQGSLNNSSSQSEQITAQGTDVPACTVTSYKSYASEAGPLPA
jgi:hypothetical protein